MASVAELLISGQQGAIGRSAQAVGEGISGGVDLAIKSRQVKQQRADLEHKKKQFRLDLFDGVKKSYDALNKATSPLARTVITKGIVAKLKVIDPSIVSEDVQKLIEKDTELSRLEAQRLSRAIQESGGEVTPEFLKNTFSPYTSAEGMIAATTKQAAEAGKNRRASEAAQAQRVKNITTSKQNFVNKHIDTIRRARKTRGQVDDYINKIKTAQRTMTLAMKPPYNIQAFNQAVTTVISLTQDRISDQDFRLFSRDIGIGRLLPGLQRAIGKVPTKTARNTLEVLNVIAGGLEKGKMSMINTFKAEANGLLRHPGASHSGFGAQDGEKLFKSFGLTGDTQLKDEKAAGAAPKSTDKSDKTAAARTSRENRMQSAAAKVTQIRTLKPGDPGKLSEKQLRDFLTQAFPKASKAEINKMLLGGK